MEVVSQSQENYHEAHAEAVSLRAKVAISNSQNTPEETYGEIQATLSEETTRADDFQKKAETLENQLADLRRAHEIPAKDHKEAKKYRDGARQEITSNNSQLSSIRAELLLNDTSSSLRQTVVTIRKERDFVLSNVESAESALRNQQQSS